MVLILFLLIGLYFFPILFQNQVFYYGDIVSIFLPLRQWFFDQLRQGVLALWNPYIYSGYPFFADMTLSNYYLPAWLLYFDNSIKAVSWLLVGHFLVAGYFTYRLGQLLKFSRLASLFSAIIYTFSGIMVNYIADPQRFFVISLFPFFFYALFKARIILIAIALTLQIFAGHIQYVFIELLACMLFWRQGKGLAVAAVLAGLLTAVSLLPMLEFIPYTTRPDTYQDLSIYQSFSLNPISIIRFALAHFWGIKNQGSAWGTMDTSSIGYLGFLPLVLIGLNLKKLIENKITLKFLFIAGLSLMIAFGTYLPFFNIFTTYIPIFRLFRNPMVFLSLYTFFMALLAGRAYELFKFDKIINWLKWGFLVLMLVSGLVYMAVIFNPGIPYQLLIRVAALINKSLSAFHNLETDRIIAGFILNNLMIIGLLTSLALFSKRKLIIILVTVIDLFLFTRSNLYLTEVKYFSGQNPIAAYLQENLGTDRFLSSSETVPYSGLNDFYGTLDRKPLTKTAIGEQLADQIKLLPPNFAAAYGLPTVNGYTSFVMKKYNERFQVNLELNPIFKQILEFNPLIGQRGSDLALSKIDFAKIDIHDPIFNQLAVKYWVSDRDLGLPETQLAYRDGDVSVYRNDQVLPRAVLMDDQDKIIEEPLLSQPNSNQLILAVKNRGKLVIHDTFYPGWQARVNDQPVTIYPYEDIFRSVEVIQDNSRVEFNFRPRSFYLGAWISLISLVLVLIYEKIHQS